MKTLLSLVAALKLSLFFMLSLLPLSSAFADVVVDWNLTDNTGTEISEAPNSVAANITGLSMTRGAGLTTSGAAGSFSSAGWESAAAGALSNEYISFGFTVNSGYQVDLNGLNIGTRSSGTGPGTIGLFYNGDNFASPLATFTQPSTTFVNSAVDLTALSALTGTVEFRLIEIGNTPASGVGATASGGTFRVTDYFVGAIESTNVQISGTVAVPEASAFLFAGLIAGAIGVCGTARKFWL